MDESIRALRELLNRVEDPRAMGPDDLAYFLRIFREISNSLFEILRDDTGLATNRLSDDEMRKVDGVFAELANNFFPMAHTNRPLAELQIIEREVITQAVGFLRFTEGRLLEELRRQLLQLEHYSNDVRRYLEQYPQMPQNI